MTQHAALTPERWSAFDRPRQLLMIANEMSRASRLLAPQDLASLRLCYERVLRLLDLTVQVNAHPPLRRELLRWRDLVAALYVRGEVDPAAHREAFRALLQLQPDCAAQIPHMLV